MSIDTKIKTWLEFKDLISQFESGNINFEKYQLNNESSVYFLALQNEGLIFTFELDQTKEFKDGLISEMEDYEQNYQSDFIISNT